MKTYFIIPTNENQALNYTHTFKGTLAQTKSKAEYITSRLRDVLTQGSIGCKVLDQSGKEISFLSISGNTQKKETK